MVMRALDFMKKAHEGQTRWDGSPYWKHPEQVANILKSWKIDDPNVIIAAYLHDVLEDTKVTYNEICMEYGFKVVGLVQELTFPKNVSDSDYFEQCYLMSNEAKLIKIADILSNITDISSNKSHKFTKKRLEALNVLTESIRLD